MRFLGKNGVIRYFTGTLEDGLPNFYVVGFDNGHVMAISTDWLEPR